MMMSLDQTTAVNDRTSTKTKKTASDQLKADNDSDDDEQELSLRVGCSNSSKTVGIQVWSSTTVADLKTKVRQALGPSAEGRYLRLIAKGRLLTPDAAGISSFPIQDDDFLHAVLTDAGIRGGHQADLATGTTRRNRGAGVDANGRAERPVSDDEAHDTDDEESGRERLGFDRLRSSGLSRHEITAMRTYFSRQVDRFLQRHPDTASDEPDPSRRRLLQEDAWMQTQGPHSEFRVNVNLNHTNPLFPWNAAAATALPRASPESYRTTIGTDRDFMWGLSLGFCVGFLMLVWMWMPTVPHKQKLGILTGISLRLALTLLQAQGDEEALEE